MPEPGNHSHTWSWFFYLGADFFYFGAILEPIFQKYSQKCISNLSFGAIFLATSSNFLRYDCDTYHFKTISNPTKRRKNTALDNSWKRISNAVVFGRSTSFTHGQREKVYKTYTWQIIFKKYTIYETFGNFRPIILKKVIIQCEL